MLEQTAIPRLEETLAMMLWSHCWTSTGTSWGRRRQGKVRLRWFSLPLTCSDLKELVNFEDPSKRIATVKARDIELNGVTVVARAVWGRLVLVCITHPEVVQDRIHPTGEVRVTFCEVCLAVREACDCFFQTACGCLPGSVISHGDDHGGRSDQLLGRAVVWWWCKWGEGKK